MGFMNISTTAPAASLGSWALVAPLVLSRFLGPLVTTAAEGSLVQGLLRHKAQLQADDAAPAELPPELSGELFTRFADKAFPGLEQTLDLLRKEAEPVELRLGNGNDAPEVVHTLQPRPSPLDRFTLEGLLLGWQCLPNSDSESAVWTPHTRYARHLQRKLTAAINARRDAVLFRQIGVAFGAKAAAKVALHLSAREATAAAVVSASPADPHTRLSDFETAVFMARRILVDAPVVTNALTDSFTCDAAFKGATCKKMSDRDADHGFRCQSKLVHGGRTTAHWYLASAFTRIVKLPALSGVVQPRLACTGARVEPLLSSFYERRQEGQGRQSSKAKKKEATQYRADMLLVWPGRAASQDDRIELVDFTIADPQPEKSGHERTSDPSTNLHGSEAAAAAERRKVNDTTSRFVIPPHGAATFTPFGADTQGALGPAATTLLNKLASSAFPTETVEESDRYRSLPNPYRAHLLRQMRAYLGTAIIKGSAEVVRRWAFHCVPPQHLSADSRQALRTRSERLRDV
jgi:hypothetical protein